MDILNSEGLHFLRSSVEYARTCTHTRGQEWSASIHFAHLTWEATTTAGVASTQETEAWERASSPGPPGCQQDLAGARLPDPNV